MDQPILPLDLLGSILLYDLKHSHKLICKTLLDFIDNTHPLRLWFKGAVREIIRSPSILGIYQKVKAPSTYVLLKRDQVTNAVSLITRVRAKATFTFEEWAKPSDRTIPQLELRFNKELNDGLYCIIVWRFGICFVLRTNLCDGTRCCSENLKALKSNMPYLTRLFKD